MHITNKFNFDFDVSEPKKVGNIAIFGLSPTAETKREYLSLSDALTNNQAAVSEVSVLGSVSSLLVKNYSNQNLLLVEGNFLLIVIMLNFYKIEF